MASGTNNGWRQRACEVFEWVAVGGDVSAGGIVLVGAGAHWSAIATLVAVSARAASKAVAERSRDDPSTPDV
jgi:hypothetical protein